MAALSVVRLGHPALRVKSKAVGKKELDDKKFQKFLDDLAATCLKNEGAGIAAPQVAVNKRVIVVHVDPNNKRYPGRPHFPLTIVINPKVVRRSKTLKEDWEGDLSANIRGLVPRAKTCAVTGIDRNGKAVKFELKKDFHARVFQHEIDHLDGKFFTDRMRRKDTLTELKEWEKYWKDKPV